MTRGRETAATQPRAEKSPVKCPCLYSSVAPICRADTESMRIPPTVHLNRFCLTEHYRRCDLYRRFLEILAEKRERWRAQGASRGRTAGEDGCWAERNPARKH